MSEHAHKQGHGRTGGDRVTALGMLLAQVLGDDSIQRDVYLCPPARHSTGCARWV